MISIGVDTGAEGAIARIDGQDISGVDVVPDRKHRGLDDDWLVGVVPAFGEIGTHVWIEDNTSRPGEVPDYAHRHGITFGQLRIAFLCFGFVVNRVSPVEWCARLGLKGKDADADCRIRAAKLVSLYPVAQDIVYGPRGGVRKGVCDALLIAHYGQLCLSAGGGVPAAAKSWCKLPAKGLYQPEPDFTHTARNRTVDPEAGLELA